jgi:hypothetical protein
LELSRIYILYFIPIVCLRIVYINSIIHFSILSKAWRGITWCSAAAACADSGVTGVIIVVVPIISLYTDLLRQCKIAGVMGAEWEGRRPIEHASIILVTPESAIKKGF